MSGPLKLETVVSCHGVPGPLEEPVLAGSPLYLSPTVISSLCFDQVWFTVLLHCGSLCLLRMEAVLIRGEMYLPRKHVTSKGKFSRSVTS